MYSIKILDSAEKEFSDSAKWYDEQSEGLGDRFVEAIRRKLQLIQEFPDRYPKRKGNFRETPVKIFPYLIVYTFYEKEDRIVINSIFHTSRRPSKKYKK